MAGILTAAVASTFSGVTPDPYFEYTTLLLPGSGTNGTQNNSFLDGSTNNFTITRNGNTTQGTFSPFSQTGWGNYFGGSGNYLKVADGTALDLPGDFTLEGWFYFSSLSSNNGIIGYGSEAASQNGFSLYWAASSVNKLRIYSNGATLLTGTTTLSANTWNHIAIVRSGSGSNNLTVYVNGAVDQTATNTTSFTGVAALGMGIGVNYDGTFYNPFTGYASNIRLVKGQALATGAFTPPTSPVSTSSVGWTGANAAASLTGTVSVLTCQSNRFVDNSSSPLAITVTGSPTVVAFSPFNPSASWSAATNGGSGYFDGNGDYLTTPNVTALNLYNVTNTVECWVYPLSFSTQFQLYGTDFDGTYYTLFEILDTSGYPRYISRNGTAITGSSGITLNQWNHVAFGRSGSTQSIWVNGIRVASGTITTEDQWGTAVITIGRFNAVSRGNGYLSSLRVVKGTDVYGVSNTTITVPTAPLTAITNTSLLLNFTNAGIYDATSKNDLETVGDAQISNAITPKWGSTSIKFDGTGDYLRVPDSPLFSMGSGNFTIDGWVYRSGSGATQIICCQGGNTGSSTSFGLQINSSNQLSGFVYSGTTLYITNSTATVSANQWVYVAMVRDGNTITLYINGSADGTLSVTGVSVNDSAQPLGIGTYGDTVGAYFNGYIQDLRITRGYARTITTPTAAFPTL